MPKSFWTELAITVLAATGAAWCWLADVKYLPSMLIIVCALMATSLFADIEDRLLGETESADVPNDNPKLLYFVRFARPAILLIMGVLAIALLF